MDKLFGGGPDFSLFNSVASELSGLWGWVLAAGVVLAIVTFAISAIMLGGARDNMQKSTGAIMGMKNAVYGLAALLIAVPLLIALAGGISI